MRLVARLRMWLARHPWARWVVVAVAASISGILMARHGAAVERERAAWGTAVQVVVATAELTPGTPISAAVVSLAPWPEALVSEDALRAVPAGAVARQRVARGEVLHHHDVAASGSASALLPAGTEGVGVPVGLSRAGVGDVVSVVADGRRLAGGTVVALNDAEVVGPVALVALAPSNAPAVATASREGRAVLVVSASPPPPPPG